MPAQPFTLNVQSNPTSDDTQGYFKVTLRSGVPILREASGCGKRVMVSGCFGSSI